MSTHQFGIIPDLHIVEAEAKWQGEWLHRHIVDYFTGLHEKAPFTAFLVAGDLAGHKVPHIARPTERNLVSRVLATLAALAPVIVCRGNHDALGDWDHLGLIPNVHFVDEPEVLEVEGCAVMVLPWLDASQVDGGGAWGDRVRDVYMGAIEDFAETLTDTASRGGARVLLAHGAVHGAQLSSGQPRLPYTVPTVPREVFDDKKLFDAVVFGHIHWAHQVTACDVPTVQAGSCFTSRHGENPNKGPMTLLVRDGKAAFASHTVEAIPRLLWGLGLTPNGEPRFTDLGDAPAWPGELAWPHRAPEGALVKLRVEAPRSAEPTMMDTVARLRLKADSLGVARLAVELRWEQEVRARAGARAVAEAVDLDAQAEKFWKAQPTAPPPAVRDRARALLRELEKAAATI